MGIWGLESFMEKECRGGCRPVDLAQVAEEVRVRRPSSVRPSLIVDLSCCQRLFYANLDTVCGGQGHSLLYQLETFIRAVEKAGINLIFVCDGKSPEWKLQKRLERKNENIFNVCQTFDELEGYILPQQIARKLFETTTDRVSFNREANQIKPNIMVSKLVEGVLGQKITFSESSEDADKLLAKMTRDPALNVFGIISQDSDYLLYQLPDQVRYFSARHLDYKRLYSDGKSLLTKEYDRFALARHLQLRVKQLPLFGALNGNDFLTSDLYDKFHRRLTGISEDERLCRFQLFYAIAKFIRDQWLTADPFISTQKLDEISMEVFGSTENSLSLRNILRDYFLLDTVNSHSSSLVVKTDENANEDVNVNLETKVVVDVNSNITVDLGSDPDVQKIDASEAAKWQDIMDLFNRDCGLLYVFLTMKPFESSVVYEDYRRSGIVPTLSVLTRKFRQRFYGVLFYEKPGALKEPERNEFIVKFPEYLIEGPNTIFELQMLDLAMPPKCHPGLRNLLKGTGKVMAMIQWRIFAHIVCPKMSPRDFRGLSKDFLYTVCQLCIMQNDWTVPVLYKFEVELLLILQQKLLAMSKEERISQKLTTKLVAPRGVHIAALFTNGLLSHLQDLFPVIIPRAEHLLGILHFDGVLFQSMYSKFVLGGYSYDGIATKEELDSIKPYYDLVTLNGELIRDNFKRVSVTELPEMVDD